MHSRSLEIVTISSYSYGAISSGMTIVVWPLYLYNAGTEHVGFSPTRQTSRASSAKRREVFGDSHERLNGINLVGFLYKALLFQRLESVSLARMTLLFLAITVTLLFLAITGFRAV